MEKTVLAQPGPDTLVLTQLTGPGGCMVLPVRLAMLPGVSVTTSVIYTSGLGQPQPHVTTNVGPRLALYNKYINQIHTDNILLSHLCILRKKIKKKISPVGD